MTTDEEIALRDKYATIIKDFQAHCRSIIATLERFKELGADPVKIIACAGCINGATSVLSYAVPAAMIAIPVEGPTESSGHRTTFNIDMTEANDKAIVMNPGTN